MKLMICKGKGFNSISIKSLDDLDGNIEVYIGALIESLRFMNYREVIKLTCTMQKI